MRAQEMHKITLPTTAATLKSFIDVAETDKERRQRLVSVTITGYLTDGDTVRPAFDWQQKTGTSAVMTQPVLAGVPKTWELSYGDTANHKVVIGSQQANTCMLLEFGD